MDTSLPSETVATPADTPSRRRWRLLLRWSLTVIVAALVLGWLVSCTPQFREFVARAAVTGPNTNKTIDPADDPTLASLRERGVSRQLRVDVGPPEASLSVWIVDPPDVAEDRPARGTVLVMHGIQDQKASMLGVGRMLAEAGYRAVLIDSRAHGRSTGQWLTFGVVESRDASQVIDELERCGLMSGSIGAYGVSYGGSTAIQLAARDPRVKAVVVVATFTSMRDTVPRHVRIYAPVVGWFMSDKALQQAVTRSGEIAGFNPDDASPLLAIGRTKAQVLLITGRGDLRMPASYARRLHEAAPDHSKLITADGDHATVMLDRGGVLRRETLEWFEQWLE
jgi:pimeloyl-ACP methyl ester carboxylesterase